MSTYDPVTCGMYDCYRVATRYLVAAWSTLPLCDTCVLETEPMRCDGCGEEAARLYESFDGRICEECTRAER